MAGAQADLVYRNRDVIAAELVANFQSRVPNALLTPDSNLGIHFTVAAASIEGLYLMGQLLFNDMFVPTMDRVALIRTGDERGVPVKAGALAHGDLLFTGVAGTGIDIGTEVAAPQPNADALIFATTLGATIPSPGSATAPVAADLSSGNVVGTCEWACTFVTDAGETMAGALSNALTVTSRTVRLTSIPLGGAGTIARRVYRMTNGGQLKYVAQVNDNTTTTYDDNILFASLGGNPPSESTAEAITVPAQAIKVGVAYNVAPATITTLVQGSGGIRTVSNPSAFTGGADSEGTEEYRARVLMFVRNPWSGSKEDLEALALTVQGIGLATAFINDPSLGHTTIRVAAEDGTVPTSDAMAAVDAAIVGTNVASTIVHTDTFDAAPIDVAITVTPDTGHTVSDIRPQAIQAIKDYINSVPVADIFHIAGVYKAVYGLPGVVTLVVTAPASDIPLDPTEKATPGTITVS